MSDPFYMSDNFNLIIRTVDALGIINTMNITSSDSVFNGNGGFTSNWGMTSDSNGNIYVVDEGFGARCVFKIDTATGILTRVFGGGGSGALGWIFNDLYEVCLDLQGNLIVNDPFKSWIVAANTQSTTQTIYGVSIPAGGAAVIAGGATTTYTGDGTSALNAGLNQPYGVRVDPSGNLFICDQGHNAIRMVNPSGTISTICGNGTLGFSGDGGLASSATLASPTPMTTDKAGNIYFSDLNNNRIRAINRQSTTQVLAGVSINAGCINTVFGNGTAGFGGDGSAATSAQFDTNWGALCIDNSNNLLVSQTRRHFGVLTAKVRMVDAATNVVNTIAGFGTGATGYSGDGGPATSAVLGVAFGIAVIPTPSAIFCGGMNSQAVGNPLKKGTAHSNHAS